MAGFRKFAMIPELFAAMLSMTGCSQPSELLTDLLMEMEEPQAKSRTQPETQVQPETIPETWTEPETALPETIPETLPETMPETGISAPLQTAEMQAPQSDLQYATPEMLAFFEYFAGIEECEMAESIAGADWANAPYFTDSEQLRLYLHAAVGECRTQIPVIVTPSCRVTALEEFEEHHTLSRQAEQIDLTKDGTRLTFVVYTVQYTTGALCLQAEKNGDFSQLDARDRAAYQEAVRFLTEELDRSASPLEQEQQIHDYICRRTVYADSPPTEEGRESYRMASGVLVDGEANCMGYSDAFWMLASMAGFTVQKDCNEEHMWNLITLEDGLHLVDVTWDDDGLILPDGSLTHTYRFFNAGMDAVQPEYQLDEGCPTLGIVPSCSEHRLDTGEYVLDQNFGN